MNQATARDRKIAYFVGILVLLIPIIVLGMPSGGGESSGGTLARMRYDYDLGDSNLGQVDPTSATMNLLLLGMRGVAVSILRLDLDTYKDEKEWGKMEATTNSVLLLQPHYIEVWRFLSWNLAYNVSAEWDGVPDRFYWVKKGGKFAQRGTTKNTEVPELFWETGRVWGQKIGRSDESRYFRKYFLKDPDEKVGKGLGDPEINPEQQDNYLVAKRWFTNANLKEDKREQHIMMRALFRSYPARSQLDYAEALQRDVKEVVKSEQSAEEGNDDETRRLAVKEKFSLSRAAFERGFTEWTNDYGKMPFKTSECVIYMEAKEDDVKNMARESNVPEAKIHNWLKHYQNTTNYRYWRERASSEKDSNTADAHWLLYEGEHNFKNGKLEAARVALVEGMDRYATLLDTYKELQNEDLTIEEGLWGVLLWRKTLDLQLKPVPENYKLKAVWEKNQGLLPQLQDRFNSMGF